MGEAASRAPSQRRSGSATGRSAPATRLPQGKAGTNRSASVDHRFHVAEDSGAAETSGKPCRFRSGQTIFAKGDPARLLYEVVRGGVRLVNVDREGTRRITRLLLPGDVLGLERGTLHSLTAEAVGETVLRCRSRAAMEHVDERSGGCAKGFMELVWRELGATREQLFMLAHSTAKERVALLLLQLAKGIHLEDGAIVELPVSRRDMAGYLGLTIETVCRAISLLKREGVIAIPRRHQIRFCDVAALEAIVDGDNR